MAFSQSRTAQEFCNEFARQHTSSLWWNPALHWERRGARLTRREEGAYWPLDATTGSDPSAWRCPGERYAPAQQSQDDFRMTVLGRITFGDPDAAPGRR